MGMRQPVHSAMRTHADGHALTFPLEGRPLEDTDHPDGGLPLLRGFNATQEAAGRRNCHVGHRVVSIAGRGITRQVEVQYAPSSGCSCGIIKRLGSMLIKHP